MDTKVLPCSGFRDSFVDHKKEPIEGFKWSGMPMGETIQFVPSMLDAGYTVVAVSYEFSTRENHYMSLIKTSLLIQRDISLQIYFFGIVYFFRYVQISSTVENDCAYTVFSFSGGRGYFQLCEFQQLRRNNQFFKFKSFYVQFFNSRFSIS